MRTQVVALVVAVAISSPAQTVAPSSAKPVAAAAVERSAADLPVRRVVLYKNGVGYFEHSGRVRGAQDLEIKFTTAQLNDVLKSLTVVDLGGGQVTGVRYNSIAPLSERLSTLRVPLGENTSREEFLRAMRGSRVEVRNGSASATGRLLSVEERTKTDRNDATTTTYELALMTDGGELRTFELTPATTVRFTDAELNKEVSRYMALIASSRAKDVRLMTIGTSGSGEREVNVSYISEVPVWKSTYRLVLPEKNGEKALLQGWAVVDNTVGEDWRDVQLTLVAGAPQSFIQQISQPLYMRRPTVPLPTTAMLTPQTHEGTVMDNEVVNAAVPPPPPPPMAAPQRYDMAAKSAAVGRGRGGAVGGVPGGVIGGIVSGATESVEVASAADALESSMGETAEGGELGDLFQYALKQKITVLQNQSALVPIVQSRIEADKVTIWNESERVPLRALWLKNSSGLTLDGGTFNIVEGSAFAGEAVMKELKPDERRLLSYAADTGVRVKLNDESKDEPYARVRVFRGLMTLTREQRSSRTYTIHNSDTMEKNVVIEHPARNGWKFIDDLKPEESTESFHRFRVVVAPDKTADFKVAEYHPEETVWALTNINSDLVVALGRDRELPPQLRQAFQRILDKKNEIANVDMQLRASNEELGRIHEDQNRVRENMKALKGSSEEKSLTQRYVTQLNQQEDRLGELQKQITQLAAQRAKLNEELTRIAMEITVDEKL